MSNEISIKITASTQTAAPIAEVEKQAKGLGNTLKDVGKIAAGVLAADLFMGAAQRMKEFVHSSIEAGKDLGESVNAVGKVFDGEAGKVEEWADKNANAFGLSKRAFNELATPLGALLKNSGLAMDEVSDHTIRLTERAADMASVFNTDVDEALTAIQAGLRGESDPLERFGVGLSAAKVEARALADTGKATASSLTAQELILARLNIIYDQTADSAGDFADTTDGLANSARVANAQIEDAKAKLGEGLLPVMAKAYQVGGDLAEVFGKLPAPLQTTTAAIAAIAGGLVILLPRIAAMKTAMTELNITMAASRSFIAGPWGLAIGGAIALITAFAVGQHQATERANELASALDLQKGALDANNRSVIAAKLEQQGLLATARELHVNTEDLVSAILGDKDAMDSLGLSTANANRFTTDATLKHSEFSKAVQQMAADVDAAGHSQERKTDATKASSKATMSDTDALKANVDALKKQADKLNEEFDPMLKLVHAQQDVTAARKEYTKAVKEHGPKSDEAREAELKMAAAILDTNAAAGAAAGAFNGKLSPALRDTLKAGGATEAQLKDIEAIFAKAQKAGERFAKPYNATANLKVFIHSIGSTHFDPFTGDPVGSGGGFSGHAFGGAVGAATGGSRGGLTLVGDGAGVRRGELVRLPFGASVIPAGQSQQMMEAAVSQQRLGGGGNRLALDVSVSRQAGLAFLDGLVEGLRFKIRNEGNNDPQEYLKG